MSSVSTMSSTAYLTKDRVDVPRKKVRRLIKGNYMALERHRLGATNVRMGIREKQNEQEVIQG